MKQFPQQTAGCWASILPCFQVLDIFRKEKEKMLMTELHAGIFSIAAFNSVSLVYPTQNLSLY